MEQYIESGTPFAETKRLRDIIGVRVISKSGDVIGRVSQIRMDVTRHKIEGVLVRLRNLRRIYIEEQYINRITDDAVLLKIDPLITNIGKPVVSADGKRVGTVISVKRTKLTNELEAVVIRRRLIRRIVIPANEIARVGASLILKKTYEHAKKDIFN